MRTDPAVEHEDHVVDVTDATLSRARARRRVVPPPEVAAEPDGPEPDARRRPRTLRNRPPRPRNTWPGRFWGLVLLALFAAPIAAPLALLALGVQASDVENREATELPAVEDLLALDVEAFTQLQGWFRDRLPGLDAAIAADAHFDLAVRGTSPNPDVVLGREGWLFLNWTLEQPCLDADDVAAVDGTVRRLRRAAREGGRQLVLLVVPDKAAVHPEMLRGPDRRRSCARANAEALAGGLADRNSLVPLDLLDGRAARGEPTYHQLDSHWTDEAAHAVVRLLVEHLGVDTSDARLVDTGTNPVPEDLRTLQGLRELRDDVCWAMVRPGVTVDRSSVDCRPEVQEPVVTRATTASSAPLLPPTTLVSDSFGLAMIEVLPAWFQRLTVLHKPDLQDFDLGATVEDSRIVVLQVVQRRLPAILGDPEIVSALERALATPYAS